MDRINQLVSHLTPGSVKGLEAIQTKSPDDVVITLAVRTPLCKARKGGLKDTTSEELLVEIFKQAIAHSSIDAGLIGDIAVGTCLPKKPLHEARSAMLAAGIPEHVPVQIINRFCSSGLMAVTDISNKIKVGQIDIGLAVGIESMSQNPDDPWTPNSVAVNNHPPAKACCMPMGWTSENVAGDFGVSREDMDALSALSFQRAEHAQKSGYFKNEIVPITVNFKAADGTITQKTISADDGIRYGTTKEALGKIKAAFPQWTPSQTTGGNASQVTDGAAAVLLMKRSKAEALGLKILGKHVATAVTGLAPRIMGIAPRIAIPMVLTQVGISQDDVDLFEINEAFSSMYVYCTRELGLDINKVNVNGGAVALGHPLGCTGARQVATGLNELARRDGKILVTSMCIGGGQGAAAVFVRD
ncbi:thiolase [Irpex rosettiformis]|uniref:Thiolase n=1 Tax=Irpex rosettiformis TaxID=378272 RepID=A0ACB8UJL8_9APHY|nr:thiolase [Irpex rosettiformis]